MGLQWFLKGLAVNFLDQVRPFGWNVAGGLEWYVILTCYLHTLPQLILMSHLEISWCLTTSHHITLIDFQMFKGRTFCSFLQICLASACVCASPRAFFCVLDLFWVDFGESILDPSHFRNPSLCKDRLTSFASFPKSGCGWKGLGWNALSFCCWFVLGRLWGNHFGPFTLQKTFTLQPF